MLFPEVPDWRKGLAFAGGYTAAVPLGLWCYRLLSPLRGRGRLGRFVAQFWAWWVAVAAGTLVAVWIGGLWVFAARARGTGVWLTEPMSRWELVVIATVMALGNAAFGLLAPYHPPEPEAARVRRERPVRKRKPFARSRSRRRGT